MVWHGCHQRGWWQRACSVSADVCGGGPCSQDTQSYWGYWGKTHQLKPGAFTTLVHSASAQCSGPPLQTNVLHPKYSCLNVLRGTLWLSHTVGNTYTNAGRCNSSVLSTTWNNAISWLHMPHFHWSSIRRAESCFPSVQQQLSQWLPMSQKCPSAGRQHNNSKNNVTVITWTHRGCKKILHTHQ